jgi:tetratricopeptide (TPR) repeat protein
MTPPSTLIAAFMISSLLSGEAHAQEYERVNNVRATPAGAPGEKRVIPKVVLDPEDRPILLKSLASAIEDAEAVPDPQQRATALANMAGGQVLANDLPAARATLKQAYKVVEELPGELTKALAFLSMATQLGAYGDMDDARAEVKSAVALMKSLDPVNRIHVARSLARAQAMIGEEVGAKEALEGALEALTTMTSVSQWQQSLAVTVDGMLDAGDFDRVFDIAEAIPEFRNDLKQTQLSKVAGKMSKIAPALAKSTLARGLRIARGIEVENAKCEALSSIAVALAETGDVAGATAIAAELAKKSNDSAIVPFVPLVYQAIATSQFKAGDKAEAKASFDEAIRHAKAIAPDNSDLQARRLHFLAAAQAKTGAFADAARTADLIENDDYHKSLTFSEIGGAQAVVKDYPAAIASFRRAFELAKAIKPRPGAGRANVHVNQQQAFYEAAYGLATARDFDGALKVAEHAISLDPNQQTYHARYALSQIAGERAWTGDIDGALKAAGAIEDEWNRYNAYERVAKLEAEAGGVAHACGWITKFDDPQIRLRLMWSVVKGLAKGSSYRREGLPDLSYLKKKGTAK